MKKIALAATVAALVLSGCANDGRYYRSDTYAATSVNQAQQVRTVEILSIGTAQVAVSNTDIALMQRPLAQFSELSPALRSAAITITTQLPES